MKQKIVLGLSGGIDSLVSAILLKNKGYTVIGINLNLWKTPEKQKIAEITDKLKIENHYIDLKETFKKNIVDNFINDYLNAKTPNPCTICNDIIKWKYLINFADKNNIKHIATGHYINIHNENNKFYIYKGNDKKKDQSYFLWRLNQEYISRTICPLGEYTKLQVKEIAKNYGFNDLSKQKESMSICFLENNNYRNFIKNNINKNHKSLTVGNVYDTYNNLIGTHNGIANYTIGQKSGLKLSVNKKMAVCKININDNSLIVDETLNLYNDEFLLENFNFVDINDIKSKNITVMIRGFGLNPQKNAKLEMINNNLIKIKLKDKAWAIAPGQPAVFYIKNKLIGGGYIK